MFKFLFGKPEIVEVASDTFPLNLKTLTKDNYKEYISHGSMIMFSNNMKAGNFGMVRLNGNDIDKAMVVGIQIKTVMNNYSHVFLMHH